MNPLSGNEARWKLGNLRRVLRGTNFLGGKWLDPLDELSEHFVNPVIPSSENKALSISVS